MNKIKNYFSNTKNIVNLVLIFMIALIIYNCVFWQTKLNILCFDFLIPLIYFLSLKFYKKSNLKMLNIIFSIWAIIFCIKDLSFIKFNFEFGYYSQIIQMLLPRIMFLIFTILTLWCSRFNFFKNNITKTIIKILFIILILYYVYNIFSGFHLNNILKEILNVRLIDYLFIVISSIYKISMIIYLKQYADYKIGDVKNG